MLNALVAGPLLFPKLAAADGSDVDVGKAAAARVLEEGGVDVAALTRKQHK